MDRRKARTQQWLQASLRELLQERDYDAITIRDIADRADTTRITFYRHYRDKHELLRALVSDFFQRLEELIQPISISAVAEGDQTPPMLTFYQFVEQNHRFFHAMLVGSASPLVTPLLREHISNYIRRNIDLLLPINSLPFPRSLVAGYLAASLLGSLIWWLENDRPYPSRYMAEASMWLNMFGFFGMSSAYPELRPPELPPIE